MLPSFKSQIKSPGKYLRPHGDIKRGEARWTAWHRLVGCDSAVAVPSLEVAIHAHASVCFSCSLLSPHSLTLLVWETGNRLMEETTGSVMMLTM